MPDGNLFLEMARELAQNRFAVSRLEPLPSTTPLATPVYEGLNPYLTMARTMKVPVPSTPSMFQKMAQELAGNAAERLVKSYTAPSSYQQTETFGQERIGAVGALTTPKVTLRYPFTDSEFKSALTAIYRQIFGNTYVMESERPIIAESQLKDGKISVRGFIRLLAKSEVYKTRFFYKTNQNRFIELNHKLLLGRAPYNQADIGSHLNLYLAKGYEAEIDSYVDSEEYQQFFGEDTVPYFRGFKYQVGQVAQGFNRLLDLYGGYAGSDTDRNQSGQTAKLIESLASPGVPVVPPAAPLYFTRETDRAMLLSGQYKQPSFLQQTETFGQERIRATAVVETAPVSLRAPFSQEQFEGALYAIYRQIFGNTYVMESERPTVAESQLRDGKISVRGFIRLVAKSEVYKSRFFYSSSQNRFIEVNHKLLLGRAPYDQAEISKHVVTYNTQGYEAEIDTYLDSAEYQEQFGEDTVPFVRGFKTQTGQTMRGFTGLVELYDGYATSDSDWQRTSEPGRLTDSLARPVREASSEVRVPQFVNYFTQPSPLGQTETFGQEQIQATAVLESPKVTLRPFFTEEELQGVLRAVYKQVFGNTYVMESERPVYAESQLRDGKLTVRGFIRQLVKSEVYKTRFFYTSSQTRFIELNHKLLLGRAPYSQAEISEHVALYTGFGYEAEMDSYLDSVEYQEEFGEDTVPFFRGFQSQTGQTTQGFNRMVTLYDGYATSDSDWQRQSEVARLTESLSKDVRRETADFQATQLQAQYKQTTALLEAPQVTLKASFTEPELQGVLLAIYKQVLGKTHVMESERLVFAESQLRDSKLTVRSFIRTLVKSELFKRNFFYQNSQVRFIELNHKLLLGRAPIDQAEISLHVALYNQKGYEAEMDSYLDSAEYQDVFGEDTVPFVRGFQSQVGQRVENFNRLLRQYDGYAATDSIALPKGKLPADLQTPATETRRDRLQAEQYNALLQGLVQPSPYQQPENFGQEQLGTQAILETPKVTLRPYFTEEDLQGVLNAIYKQVLGNTYVMESERPTTAESQLRDGKITVRGFIRQLAKSEAYKVRFFYPSSQTRLIELNHKLLLGRAPYSQADIVEHLDRYVSQGYEAEIDSYLDSPEYQEQFGEDTVPFLRGFTSQAGQNTQAFNRMVDLYDGYATSDSEWQRRGDAARLTQSLSPVPKPKSPDYRPQGLTKPNFPPAPAIEPPPFVRVFQPKTDQSGPGFVQLIGAIEPTGLGLERIGVEEAAAAPRVTLRPNFTEEELQGVLQATYKQVLGNTYVMESEQPTAAESQLRDGKITVRGFIRQVVKSDLYKSRFFQNASQTRFIELNHKFLLGRAPYSQAEIAQHVALYNAQGFDAEVDFYLDSVEYQEQFGEDTVPFLRGFQSQEGQPTQAFNRMVDLYDGYATSDSDWQRQAESARLTDSLAEEENR